MHGKGSNVRGFNGWVAVWECEACIPPPSGVQRGLLIVSLCCVARVLFCCLVAAVVTIAIELNLAGQVKTALVLKG